MKESTDWQLLIGQLAAGSLVRDALLITLMEVIPDLHARLEAKVAVAAPVAGSRLPEAMRESFHTRISEVRDFLDAAYPSADDATG